MRKTIVICLFLLIAANSPIRAQSFVSELYDACFACLENNDTAGFDEKYPRVFIALVKDNVPYAEMLQKEKERDYASAFRLLDEVAEEDVLIPELLEDRSLLTLRAFPEWEPFRERADSVLGTWNDVWKELLDMQDRDQSIRLLMLEAEKRYGSREVFGLRERMKRIDAENGERVQEIIDTYGWLGPDEVGEYGSQSLFLAIQHVDAGPVQEKYLPVLKKAVEEGKAEAWQYAFLTDRSLMNRGGKQIYGTQKIIGRTPAESYVVPLQDPDRVDERRAEVGLEPLAEELAEYGIEWDAEAYKARLPEIEKLFREYMKSKK